MPKFVAPPAVQERNAAADLHAQSMSVMRTTLHCCLSTVLYHRNVLPEKSFIHQDVYFADSSKSSMMLLARGPSHRTDIFLGWLDEGALYALDMGLLSAVQIVVLPDHNRRNLALETYTFSLQYADLASTAGLESKANGVIHGDAHGEKLRATIDAVAEFCKKMPALPKEKYLSMTLFMDPEAEGKMIVEGFGKMNRDVAVFPRNDDWALQSKTFETMASDVHSTRLKISYMAPLQGLSADLKSSCAPIVFRDYKQTVPLVEDIDWDFIADKSSQLAKTITETETQSNAVNVATTLNGMLQPEDYTQGDTQAATMSIPHRTQPCDLVPEQYAYDKKKMHHEKRPLEALQKQAQDLHKTIGGLTQAGQMILCSCAHSREEGDMVECIKCGTWQHLHCYGYLSEEDSRRPDQHICCLCYIDPRDITTWEKLIELALHRRAMYRALRYGISTKSDFADRLGISQSITTVLFNGFRDKKYVIAASGSHKAGFKLLGKPPWVPVGVGEPSYGQMLDDLFDPTSLVEQYYKPYKSSPSAYSKLLMVQSNAELPQAVVPISERRRKADADANGDSDSAIKRQHEGDGGHKRSRKRGKIEKTPTQPLLTLETGRIIDCISRNVIKPVAARLHN